MPDSPRFAVLRVKRVPMGPFFRQAAATSGKTTEELAFAIGVKPEDVAAVLALDDVPLDNLPLRAVEAKLKRLLGVERPIPQGPTPMERLLVRLGTVRAVSTGADQIKADTTRPPDGTL